VTLARLLPPPHAGTVDRPPRPLHVRRMQPPHRASSPRAIGPKEKHVLSSSRNGRRALTTPLGLLPHLYSFITAPLSPLCRRTSRPTSYRPMSPAPPPSRCSQPWGKSTTSAPARAPPRPPSSVMANSSWIVRLRLSAPLTWGTSPTPHRSPTLHRAHCRHEPTPVSLPPSKTPNWVPHLAISL
jgi:hypothetical protein